MKHKPIILMTLLLCLTHFGCKKHEQETLIPKITDEKVEAFGVKAILSWTVDWPGKLISVVEVSENEDMCHSKIYGFQTETENHTFTVTVPELKVATNYYYRYMVWNHYYVDNKFVIEGGLFSTLAPPTVGAIGGSFTVDYYGSRVYFSQGNLQYQASTNTWCFAEHQWDFVGTQTQDYDGNYGGTIDGSDNIDISQTYHGWIDLFGWGTSRWNSGALNYQPWSTSNSTYDYCYCPSDLRGSYADADWGVYNSISNGGNTVGQWRTLTENEWDYVFTRRQGSTVNGTANARYVKANVNNVRGLILFPDIYMHPDGVSQPTNINDEESIWNVNNYSASDWAKIEANGAVFLPAAGYRSNYNGISVKDANDSGFYWSASHHASLIFNNFLVGVFGVADYSGDGYSVRLVRDAQ